MKNSRVFSFAAAVSVAAFTMSGPAQAVYVDVLNAGLITHMYSYSTHGTGDIVIRVQNPAATCQHGYWLRMTDVGAKNVYAQLLALQLANQPIRIGGHDDQRWSGSTGNYCRIDYVGTPG